MGKWTCQCGYPMNDPTAPDPNAFSIYSDELWEEIPDTADENNKIDYYDISDASYYAWQCPNCHSLMVFGEDENPNRYTFYKWIDLDSSEEEQADQATVQSSSDTVYRVASVTFSEFGEEYSYICDDESIKEDHYVVVPVGINNVEKVAHVVKVHQATQEDISYPINKLKHVIKRYSDFDKESAEKIAAELVTSGRCLKIDDFSKSVAADEYFDVLHNKLGHWWLELNGVPIPMKVLLLNTNYEKYHVDCAVHIKPHNIHYSTFQSLKLCTDFEIDASRWVDVISDEYIWGNSWELDGIQFGITCQESSEEDEVTLGKYSRVPYYDRWHSDWSDKYGFNVAWKPFESDEDLSVDFYIS
ncbi:hypothetical protein NOL38_01775 [Streptococcus suis]|uniref:hypothetical protein n=1 Tax=Streptococcus suis TaxID=1307 RepID=UPI002412C140|nr:hypothetical protein [Streptococcus suis]MDG4504993.1 hypothetical protein [Streptococcus suis]